MTHPRLRFVSLRQPLQGQHRRPGEAGSAVFQQSEPNERVPDGTPRRQAVDWTLRDLHGLNVIVRRAR
jgi:hypothetical protein